MVKKGVRALAFFEFSSGFFSKPSELHSFLKKFLAECAVFIKEFCPTGTIDRVWRAYDDKGSSGE